MIFVYRKWDNFCKDLCERGMKSVSARDVVKGDVAQPYIVLKHDVETDVPKALVMAQIEHKYGHCGSYYVQAYLMQDDDNVKKLQQMKDMGHEISYHYDVMDSCKGDIEKARKEFSDNLKLFEKNGFNIITVCQHGNPVVDRIGYTSNRDFFRNTEVQTEYSNVSDIMVNFKERANTEYVYYSDAGRKFNMIYDPINNDVINSDEKNVPYEDLDELLRCTDIEKENTILSTHPHRWTNSKTKYIVKAFIFKVVKKTAKILMKIPIFKKIMSKYYYLAKKI